MTSAKRTTTRKGSRRKPKKIDGVPAEWWADEDDEMAGRPVAMWVPSEVMADWMRVSERTLHRRDELGMPSRQKGREKHYPLPHAVAWIMAYRLLSNGNVVERLTPQAALAIYDTMNVRDDFKAAGDIRLRRK